MDAKGRFPLPAALRKQMPEGVDNSLILACAPGSRCLLIYPPAEWHKVLADLLARSNMDKRVQKFRRHFVGNAREVELDGNGRLLVPPMLREYAHLNNKLVLAGMGKHIEMWNEQDWAAEQDEILEFMNTDEAADLLAGFSY